MKAKELELLAEKVHKIYCEQYEKDHGKPYWTNGDYSKLDEKTKEYDRAIVRFMEQYADEVSRDEYEKGVCDGKKARIKRVKTFWI